MLAMELNSSHITQDHFAWYTTWLREGSGLLYSLRALSNHCCCPTWQSSTQASYHMEARLPITWKPCVQAWGAVLPGSWTSHGHNTYNQYCWLPYKHMIRHCVIQECFNRLLRCCSCSICNSLNVQDTIPCIQVYTTYTVYYVHQTISSQAGLFIDGATWLWRQVNLVNIMKYAR